MCDQNDGECVEPFPVTNKAVYWHQLTVLWHAHRCFSGLCWWLSYQILLWWQDVQPKKVASAKMQTEMVDELLDADDMANNVSTERKMQEVLDRVLPVIIMITKSAQKDWDCIPASTCKALQRASHHSEWTKKLLINSPILEVRAYFVKSNAHWWWGGKC